MKTIEEILQSKGITEKTKFHNYEYLYEAIKLCCEEYSMQYVKSANNTIITLTEEVKTELILRKFHGHTKEQWENEIVKNYPYCEIPYLVELVWNEAQGNKN